MVWASYSIAAKPPKGSDRARLDALLEIAKVQRDRKEAQDRLMAYGYSLWMKDQAKHMQDHMATVSRLVL
jgi:hypothetical protein